MSAARVSEARRRRRAVAPLAGAVALAGLLALAVAPGRAVADPPGRTVVTEPAGGVAGSAGRAAIADPASRTADPLEATPVRFLIVSSQESQVSASQAGRVERILVQLGAEVRKGQLLVAMDCADVAARRDAARAEYEAALVQHDAKLKLQGLQSAAAVEVAVAASNADRMRSQLRLSQAQLAQCSITAPFAGRVAHVHVRQGQGVTPGNPLVDLVGNGTPIARFNAPSAWLAWMRTGSALDGTVDDVGVPVRMTVRRISGRVDPASQTIEVETDLAAGAGDQQLAVALPGMSGRVSAGAHVAASEAPAAQVAKAAPAAKAAAAAAAGPATARDAVLPVANAALRR